MNTAALSAVGGFDILLVDDNARDAEMTLRTLRKRHLAARLKWVQDGAEALEYLLGPLGCLTRVVLLDIKLPKLDGLEVLRRLKENPQTQLIPVVMLTSSREESDIYRSFAAGANSYVVKPVEFEKFSAAIGRLGQYWIFSNQAPDPSSASDRSEPGKHA